MLGVVYYLGVGEFKINHTHRYNAMLLPYKLCVPVYLSPLPHSSWKPLIIFTVFIVSTMLGCHVAGVREYAAFLAWLLSFSNTHLCFPCALSRFNSPFIFSDEQYSITASDSDNHLDVATCVFTC